MNPLFDHQASVEQGNEHANLFLAKDVISAEARYIFTSWLYFLIKQKPFGKLLMKRTAYAALTESDAEIWKGHQPDPPYACRATIIVVAACEWHCLEFQK